MIRHLLRLVWNRKRQNLLVALEIFLSFGVLFAIAFTVGVNYYNWRQPLGFDGDEYRYGRRNSERSPEKADQDPCREESRRNSRAGLDREQ